LRLMFQEKEQYYKDQKKKQRDARLNESGDKKEEETKSSSKGYNSSKSIESIETPEECQENDEYIERENFRLPPLCFADLFPKRFAIPAVLTPIEEWSSKRQDGDAEFIGSGRCGRSYRLVLKGYDGIAYNSAVKVCFWGWKRDKESSIELKKEMYRDYEVYLRLKEYQGVILPLLLWYGEIVPGVADALVTEFSGTNLSDFEYFTDDIKTQCTEILSTLHNNQIVHGDIRLENFLIDQNGKVKIIDFGFSRFKEEIFEEEWQRLVLQEQQDLEESLKSRMTVGRMYTDCVTF